MDGRFYVFLAIENHSTKFNLSSFFLWCFVVVVTTTRTPNKNLYLSSIDRKTSATNNQQTEKKTTHCRERVRDKSKTKSNLLRIVCPFWEKETHIKKGSGKYGFFNAFNIKIYDGSWPYIIASKKKSFFLCGDFFFVL